MLRNRLVCQVDLASEWKTHPLFFPEGPQTPVLMLCSSRSLYVPSPPPLLGNSNWGGASVLGGDCFFLISKSFFLLHWPRMLINTEQFKTGKQVETWRLWLSCGQGTWTLWFAVANILHSSQFTWVVWDCRCWPRRALALGYVVVTAMLTRYERLLVTLGQSGDGAVSADLIFHRLTFS